MGEADPKRVLVTGGTGFVGSHLVELLLRKGYSVRCLVRDPSRLRWIKGQEVQLITGDCTIPETLSSAVKDVSLVFHVAGLTRARQVREYYEVNHLGTKNLLEACARHNPGISKFILVSSLAAAGPSQDGTPVRDSDSPRPVSDYGKSKLNAEYATSQFKDTFPVVILRPSAVYGPRDTDIYEFFRWAAKGLTIEIGGGDRFIEPCYVEDLATALLLAAEKRQRSGSVYFVAENRTYSWSAFVRALLSTGRVKARTITVPYAVAYLLGIVSELGSMVTGKPALTNRQKVREAIQKYWIADMSKIEKEIGFVAAYPLDQGLSLTWKWYREQGWV